ncbi:MAG: restriction endonuclease [Nitrospinota bacterium]|nr:MAG: restriction endonuclease [Nitrospinota bacterium]
MFLLVLGAVIIGFLLILCLPKSSPPVIAERDSLTDEKESLSLRTIEGERFVHCCEALIRQLGLEIESSTQVNEREWDLVAVRPVPIVGGRYLVQCVLLPAEALIDVTKVRLLHDMVKAEGAAKGILITNGYFTQDALQAYEEAPIELINGRRFRDLLLRYRLWEGA